MRSWINVYGVDFPREPIDWLSIMNAPGPAKVWQEIFELEGRLSPNINLGEE